MHPILIGNSLQRELLDKEKFVIVKEKLNINLVIRKYIKKKNF